MAQSFRFGQRSRPDEHRSDEDPNAVLAWSAVALFCLSVAGANLSTPLVAYYQIVFGLQPLDQTLIYSTYIASLVATLAILSVVRRPRPASTLLILTGGVLLAADASMSFGSASLPFIYTGRLLSGIGVGLATGAAASVATTILGARGRSAAGTGAVLGSLIGAILGGSVASFLPWTGLLSFVVHGGLTCVAVAAFVQQSTIFRGRRTPPPEPLAVTEGMNGDSTYPIEGRHRLAGFALGALAWSLAGAVFSLTPSLIRSAHPGTSYLVAVGPACAFLLMSYVSQLLVGSRMRTLRAWQVLIPVVLGIALLSFSAAVGSLPGLVAACVLAGIGQGPAYSLGLATVTHGAAAGQIGRKTSKYALVSYGLCGAATVGLGALGNLVGIAGAYGAATSVFVAVGVAIVLLAGPAQAWGSGRDVTTTP